MSSAVIIGSLGLVPPWPECCFSAAVNLLALGFMWILYLVDHYDREHCPESKFLWVHALGVLIAMCVQIASLSLCCFSLLSWRYYDSIWLGTAPAFDSFYFVGFSICVSAALSMVASLVIYILTERYYQKHKKEIEAEFFLCGGE